MSDYRKIWKNAFGPIPLDANGRTCEIHHIDGDRSNNSLDNLKCVTLQEHYDIHFQQGDYLACAAISKRLNLSIEDSKALSKRISERNKQQVGSKNPFYNKTHSVEWKKRHSKRMSGENHPFYQIKRPEHSDKMKIIMKGKVKTNKHLENHRQSWMESTKDNPIRAKLWNIMTPVGLIQIKNLKKYCRDNNLQYLKVRDGRDKEYYVYDD